MIVNKKYPALAINELERYQEKFVQFLALQGIEAAQWEKIKKEDKAKLAEVILDFSQGIWESRLSAIQYINVVQKQSFVCMRFDSSFAVAIGLRGEADFTILSEVVEEEAAAWLQAHADKLAIFKSKKELKDNRNALLFSYLQQGALIADDRWFNLLAKLAKQE